VVFQSRWFRARIYYIVHDAAVGSLVMVPVPAPQDPGCDAIGATPALPAVPRPRRDGAAAGHELAIVSEKLVSPQQGQRYNIYIRGRSVRVFTEPTILPSDSFANNHCLEAMYRPVPYNNHALHLYYIPAEIVNYFYLRGLANLLQQEVLEQEQDKEIMAHLLKLLTDVPGGVEIAALM
jgi:hypothetical protein